MALHSRFICTLLATQLTLFDAALLRGVQMKEEEKGKIDTEVALLQEHTAHRDIPNFDDDMLFEGDKDDEGSAEAQLERMRLNHLLGYSAKQAEQDERTDVEESNVQEEDDADAEAAVDEAVQNSQSGEDAEESETEDDEGEDAVQPADSSKDQSENYEMQQTDQTENQDNGQTEDSHKESDQTKVETDAETHREATVAEHDEEQQEPVDPEAEAERLSQEEMFSGDAGEGEGAALIQTETHNDDYQDDDDNEVSALDESEAEDLDEDLDEDEDMDEAEEEATSDDNDSSDEDDGSDTDDDIEDEVPDDDDEGDLDSDDDDS